MAAYNGYFQSNETDPYLMKEKKVALCVILSLCTGIFSLYWFYTIMKKIKILNNEEPKCAGEFLCYIFVPFYSLYWFKTRGRKLSAAAANRNIQIEDNGAMYLVLSIFFFDIINLALIQKDLNIVAKKALEEANSPRRNLYTPERFGINPAPNPVTVAAAAKSPPQPMVKTPMECLIELAKFKVEGKITQEEYDERKNDILSRM